MLAPRLAWRQGTRPRHSWWVVDHLTVGAMPMAFPVRLGRALSAVARSMPSLQIRCVPAWADHLTVERLQVGDLDAIVVVGPVTADVLCTEDL